MRAATSAIAATIAIAVTLGACASTPRADAPADIDPTGTFSLSTTIQGMAVDGQMRIAGEPGSYDGSFYSDVTGELPFSAVSVEGDRVTITADTPDGAIEIRLLFDGDTITGEWSGGNDGGAVRGRRTE